jgi:hypothetical protein
MAGFMTGLALALSAGGTIVKAVSQKKAANAAAQASEETGSAERRAAESQAELADYNAAVADLQAKDAEERGRDDESRFRRSVSMMIGSQRAGFAASNVDVGYGSTVDTQADASYLGELDALQIRNNAAREAWGYRVQGADSRARAGITRREGAFAEQSGRTQASAQRKAGTVSAIGSVLDTATSLLFSKYGFGRR